MRATMKDVARAAGVSVATVSRVLAGRERVAPAKRDAVEQACKRLGYQIDGLAAALRNGSSNSIGILVPDITNPFFPAVVRAAEHELAQAAVDVVLCDADNSLKVEAQRLETLWRRRVDALLICPVDTRGSASAIRAAASSVRVLQLERRAVDEQDFVGVDQAAGMGPLVEHIHSSGAASAVFVGLHRGMSSLVERAASFEDACETFSLALSPTVQLPFPDMANGRAYTRQLLGERAGLPDAIVCANDELAFGVLTALRGAGIRCPEDILVSGYDDTPSAELLGLTTVRQPLQELGREAARLLQHESSVPRHVRLTPTLIARRSTQPPGQDGESLAATDTEDE